MQAIAVFYQAENLGRVEHANYSPDATLNDVLADIRTKLRTDAALLFLEDVEEPADLTARLRDLAGPTGLKVHVHRCRRIEVVVTFNGAAKVHAFAPSATVTRVKRWATEKAFPMTPEEAAEHVLQITGTTDRPSPGTHLGTLVTHPRCQVRFDLVPNERINGDPDTAR